MKNNSGLDDVKMAGVKVRNPTTGFNSTYIAKNHDIPTSFTTADVGSHKSGSVNGSSPGAAFTLRGTPILGILPLSHLITITSISQAHANHLLLS